MKKIIDIKRKLNKKKISHRVKYMNNRYIQRNDINQERFCMK